MTDLLELDRTYSLQGRVQLLDYPYAAPSKCVICGSGPEANRKFIDFKQSLEFYGAVYYCTDCMGEVAQQVGYVPVKDLIDLQDAVRAICEVYTSELAELKGYRDVFAKLRDNGIGVPIIPKSKPSLSVARDVLSKNYGDTTEPAGIPDAGPDESSSVEGSNYLPSTPTHQGKRSAGF